MTMYMWSFVVSYKQGLHLVYVHIRIYLFIYIYTNVCAGAIGGAYWGMEAIPTDWLDTCEEVDTVRKLADGLFELATAV